MLRLLGLDSFIFVIMLFEQEEIGHRQCQKEEDESHGEHGASPAGGAASATAPRSMGNKLPAAEYSARTKPKARSMLAWVNHWAINK